MGAGHFKIGDKIKQADGTVGVIANVVTIQQTQEMFNLTVSEAHMNEDIIQTANMNEDIVDIEANLSEDNEVVIFFNKYSLDGLIEKLTYISKHQGSGGHIHLDYDSGLEGNIRSVVIVRR